MSPELEQLYHLTIQTQNLFEDKKAAEVLDLVNNNWEKENFYNAEEKKFIKLCCKYSERQNKLLLEEIEEQYKRLALDKTPVHHIG